MYVKMTISIGTWQIKIKHILSGIFYYIKSITGSCPARIKTEESVENLLSYGLLITHLKF